MQKRGRPRKTVVAPFGAWLWEKAQQKGFTSKTELVKQLEVAGPTFNNWSNAKAASTPGHEIVGRIGTVLKLSRREREEMQLQLAEQAIFRAKHVRASEQDRVATDEDASELERRQRMERAKEKIRAALDAPAPSPSREQAKLLLDATGTHAAVLAALDLEPIPQGVVDPGVAHWVAVGERLERALWLLRTARAEKDEIDIGIRLDGPPLRPDALQKYVAARDRAVERLGEGLGKLEVEADPSTLER